MPDSPTLDSRQQRLRAKKQEVVAKLSPVEKVLLAEVLKLEQDKLHMPANAPSIKQDLLRMVREKIK